MYIAVWSTVSVTGSGSSQLQEVVENLEALLLKTRQLTKASQARETGTQNLQKVIDMQRQVVHQDRYTDQQDGARESLQNIDETKTARTTGQDSQGSSMVGLSLDRRQELLERLSSLTAQIEDLHALLQQPTRRQRKM